MDPFETLNLETETSLVLMQELIERGQDVYWLQQEDIALVQDQPMGLVSPVTGADPLEFAEPGWSNLNSFDAVLVRKDPPFDTEYLQLICIHRDQRGRRELRPAQWQHLLVEIPERFHIIELRDARI